MTFIPRQPSQRLYRQPAGPCRRPAGRRRLDRRADACTPAPASSRSGAAAACCGRMPGRLRAAYLSGPDAAAALAGRGGLGLPGHAGTVMPCSPPTSAPHEDPGAAGPPRPGRLRGPAHRARRPAARRLRHPGPCPRADALAPAPPVLRGLRHGVRAAQRRQRHGLPRLRRPAFPPHRPGRHHAGAPGRTACCSAIPRASPRPRCIRPSPASSNPAKAWRKPSRVRSWRKAASSVGARPLPQQPALALPRQHHARFLCRGADRRHHHRPVRAARRPLVHPGGAADPDAHGFSLPRRDSIARRLIEDWMAHA